METFQTVSRGMLHIKCRVTERPYLRSKVYRCKVPDDKVPWSVPFPDYLPPDYNDCSINNKSWADGLLNINSSPNWNNIDGNIDRRSYITKYILDDAGRPLNPMGRTGLRGRGILGRWGPNHAVDPIISRWKNEKLQFIAIQRRDSNEWAIPGGMLNPGEALPDALKREFTEETLNGVMTEKFESLWEKGSALYSGYVDDPRNSDNSWIETHVVNYHDCMDILKTLKFKAGSDAKKVKWIDVSDDHKLYASHNYFIQLLAAHHGVEFDN